MNENSAVFNVKAAIDRARQAAIPDPGRVAASSMFQHIQAELRAAMRLVPDGERFGPQLQRILDIADPYCRTASTGHAFNDSDLLGAIRRFEESLIAAVSEKPAG